MQLNNGVINIYLLYMYKRLYHLLFAYIYHLLKQTFSQHDANGLMQDFDISFANAFHWSNHIIWFDVLFTQCGLMTPHGNIDLSQHWLR